MVCGTIYEGSIPSVHPKNNFKKVLDIDKKLCYKKYVLDNLMKGKTMGNHDIITKINDKSNMIKTDTDEWDKALEGGFTINDLNIIVSHSDGKSRIMTLLDKQDILNSKKCPDCDSYIN